MMPILDEVFSKLSFTVCQGNEDLIRFIELGVDENKIKKDFSLNLTLYLSLKAIKKPTVMKKKISR